MALTHMDYEGRCTLRFGHAELEVSPRHAGGDVKGNKGSGLEVSIW